MSNQELAKELLGYTYLDMERIPDTYRSLGTDIDSFKELYEREEYVDALLLLLEGKAASTIIKFLMNPLNRLK